MGQHSSRPPVDSLQRSGGSDPITGFLLRQKRLRRWDWQKVVADGDTLLIFSWPRGRQLETLHLSEIAEVDTLLLVAPGALVVPLGFRRGAPSNATGCGSGIAPHDAAFALRLQDGKEVVFCAETAEQRSAWMKALEDWRSQPAQTAEGPLPSLPVPVQTETPPEGGKGKSKGCKGKGPPLPAAKSTLKAKAKQGPSHAPKIHGLLASRQAKDVANTIFEGETDLTAPECPSPTAKGLAPLLDQFAAKPAAADPAAPAGQGKGPLRRHDDGVQLIDRQFAQNLAIAMVRVKVQHLADAAAKMSPKYARFQDARDWEQADNLVQTLTSKPDQDPLDKIRKYLEEGKELSKLRDIEQRLAPLAPIPRALVRLQLILLAHTLDSDVQAARIKLQTLVETANVVKNCALMKDVVKLIQETLKWNEAPGSQRSTWRTTSPVFPVGKQLERLSALKPTGNLLPKRFPRYNYVHLLAEVMLFKLDVPLAEDPFADAVPSLKTASQASPDLVYEELQKVSEGLRMTSNELCKNAASYGDGAEEEKEPREAQVFHICSDAVEAPDIQVIQMDDESEVSREDQLSSNQASNEAPVLRGWRVQVLRLPWRPKGSFWREDWKADREDGRQGATLWVLQPRLFRRPQWVKCFATVRMRHLVLQQVEEHQQEVAITLPGSEALQLTSLLASDVAKWLGSLNVAGFELLADGARYLFSVAPEEARAWIERLNTDAQRRGAGWLVMADVNSTVRAEHVWAVVQDDVKQLHCFESPLDYVMQNPSRITFFLHHNALSIVDDSHPLSPELSSAFHRLQKESATVAFVVKEELEVRISMGGPEGRANFAAFGCSAPVLRQWLEKLQTMARAGHLRKSYGGALDFEAPRLSWMEQESGGGDSREGLGDLSPLSPKSEGGALRCESEQDDDPFAIWARLRPSFCAEMQKAVESAEQREAMQMNKQRVETVKDCDLEDSSEEEAAAADTNENSGSDSTEAEEDVPLERLKRLEKRLKYHRHGLRKALREGERDAAEILSYFGEPPAPRLRGSLASLQEFLVNVNTFAKHFACAVREVRAHHQRQRSDSLARRMGQDTSRRFARSSSTGAIGRTETAAPSGQPRRLRRTKTRLDNQAERPVLLANDIKAQLLAPGSIDPFKRGRSTKPIPAGTAVRDVPGWD